MTKVNKTLSQRVSDAPEIIETIFAKDRILWSKGGTTEISSQIVNDPLVSALVKYYNSGYFIERDLCSGALSKTKRSLEFLINSVILPLGTTPDNVLFEFIKKVRTQISNSDNTVWIYFIHLTPPHIYSWWLRTWRSKKASRVTQSRLVFRTRAGNQSTDLFKGEPSTSKKARVWVQKGLE